jgi:addiction module HigA family antidote
MLLEEFLNPLGISQKQLAEALDMPYQHLNDIVNQRRGVSASTALHLAHFFGNSVGFWINLQTAWDVYHAQQQEGKKIKYLKSLDDTESDKTHHKLLRSSLRSSRTWYLFLLAPLGLLCYQNNRKGYDIMPQVVPSKR